MLLEQLSFSLEDPQVYNKTMKKIYHWSYKMDVSVWTEQGIGNTSLTF